MSQRRLPPIDPTRARLVEQGIIKSKEEVAQATPPPPASDKSISIDTLLEAGLQNIRGVMKTISREIHEAVTSQKPVSRTSVQNLKDTMAMLQDLKQREDDLLDEMDTETLEVLAGGK